MNTSNNNIAEILRELFRKAKEFVLENLRIVLPVAVGVVAVIVLGISLAAHNKKEAEAIDAALLEPASVSSNASTVVITIPEVPLELNAYPDVNELIKRYYEAMAGGDIDTLKTMNNYIDDTETIRIEETSKYIDEYESIDVYTKVGPGEGTYLAYVYSEVKFTDYETLVPGMQAYYICTDESGNLYINDGEESDTVTNYIREVSLQDDVIDLNNEVAVAYNDMLAEDESLAVFLVDLTDSINISVGELLAKAEGSGEIEEDDEASEEEEDAQAGISTEVVTTVKTTTTVNVRSSDSETADKLGRAAGGEEFKLIEERGNGWSEIEYEGRSAFIKSEYLEPAATETVVSVANDNDTEEATAADNTASEPNGTVTVIENVRIRATASENGEKLGTAYVGEKLELIMKQADGWTKIRYNGQTAYVKSEFVE